MDFLVDAQLPPLLCEWIKNKTDHSARHVSSLKKGLTSTDSEIWKVALQTRETIITKDVDFFDRALVSNISPIILHINLGNCSNNQLLNYLNTNWENIINLFEKNHAIISCSFEEIEYW